jgi:hypothetical protein
LVFLHTHVVLLLHLLHANESASEVGLLIDMDKFFITSCT